MSCVGWSTPRSREPSAFDVALGERMCIGILCMCAGVCAQQHGVDSRKHGRKFDHLVQLRLILYEIRSQPNQGFFMHPATLDGCNLSTTAQSASGQVLST